MAFCQLKTCLLMLVYTHEKIIFNIIMNRYLTDDDTCPKCDEEFLTGKGLNCANNCEDKQLEEKHRGVAQPMVNCCLLPKHYWAWVDCPNNLTEEEIRQKG